MYASEAGKSCVGGGGSVKKKLTVSSHWMGRRWMSDADAVVKHFATQNILTALRFRSVHDCA
jgi:hypothetical protein